MWKKSPSKKSETVLGIGELMGCLGVRDSGSGVSKSEGKGVLG